jgi:hypothetical protein
MTISSRSSAQAALSRLAARPPHAAEMAESDLPLLLRAPSIGILWMVAVLTVVTLAALSRIRLPHVARGVVAAVTAADSQQILLLLPPSSRSRVKPGQLVTVDTGGAASPVMLRIEHSDPELLDAPRARSRYPTSPGLLVHVTSPKVVVHLQPCGPRACLTTRDGTAHAATAMLGVRTLASYVFPEP